MDAVWPRQFFTAGQRRQKLLVLIDFLPIWRVLRRSQSGLAREGKLPYPER